MIYKRCIFLRDYIKTTCFGLIWPSSGFMSIKISLYKLRELRYDVEISPSNYCQNLSICTGGYYARLIYSVTLVVQGSHLSSVVLNDFQYISY